ncbi:hypothetical protein QN382_16545 [Pseudomonas sp. 10B1]|uniref:hypothetical protein n=1 Tax=unclassified Pseudomonas TaxID=196821 RepID=UPI002AB336A2|nr:MULTISPECIES: hypothetical protein [unclassified Pseudomonas]MDY7561505.1 hypothetical protein [Pseudomonas sp. AB6]MEA9976718.1 hypothetical protein [Pseudomonas sp. RTS4]MEA9994945.1 hypothetical protein [Pseudomonas sp. AA4]MEB0088298.1 hypothetical protein [Pseudomonas sp. RTI1]MEB0127109.1 hypothetical protein [Pseudomonas sp. CCC1.2]
MTVSMFDTDVCVAAHPQIHPCTAEVREALDCSELAARQALLSKKQRLKLHTDLVGPAGLFAAFSTQVAEQGRQAPYIQALPEPDPATPRTQTDQAVEFALARHHRRAYAENPFTDLSRQALCCLVYDDSGRSNLAERYAANEALRSLDSLYFIKLIATTYHTVERRLVFRGLLEHFDALMPIEQSIYQDGYRDVQQSYLDREEKLYGPLKLSKPLSVIFTEQTPESLLASLGARK